MSTTHLELGWAEDVVDRSAVVPFIERRLPILRRQLLLRTLIVGFLLTALDERPMTLTWVHETLLTLPKADQRRLGVIGTTGHGKTDHELSYRQVEDTFRLIMVVLDYAPVPIFHGIRETRRWRAFEQRQPDEREKARRKFALLHVCDRLLESTIPRRFRRHGSHSIDWTDVPSWAKGKRPETYAADTTARWRSKKIQTLTGKKAFFGYHEQSLLVSSEEGGPRLPELARRIELYPASEEPEHQMLAFLDRAKGDGVQPGDLLADSAYSYALGVTLGTWALGFTPIFDLHPNDQTASGGSQGADVIIDGLFCPAMPTRFRNIRAPKKKLGRYDPAELKVYDAEIRKRDSFRFRPHEGRDPETGCQRFACPARRGFVRCPIVPASMLKPATVPEVLKPPLNPGPCCTDPRINVGPEVASKARQKHAWLSPKWRASFERRTTVERGYGDVKSRMKGGLGREDICFMGVAKVHFARVFVYMARNYRALRNMALAVSGVSNPSRAQRRRPRRTAYREIREQLDLGRRLPP